MTGVPGLLGRELAKYLFCHPRILKDLRWGAKWALQGMYLPCPAHFFFGREVCWVPLSCLLPEPKQRLLWWTEEWLHYCYGCWTETQILVLPALLLPPLPCVETLRFCDVSLRPCLPVYLARRSGNWISGPSCPLSVDHKEWPTLLQGMSL